jgi:hypothetical protein
MAEVFEPKLSILPPEQRRLWPELAALPSYFVLCGGTAIALQLGHRASIDFDFIGSQEFDPDELYSQIPFLHQSATLQKAANTLKCAVDRGGPVQVSFFGAPRLHLSQAPLVAAGNRMQIASLLDLAGMKAAVVQKRAEAKDYMDLDAILKAGFIDLPKALSTARALYGAVFNPELTLKSLSYFEDGNLPALPNEIRERLARAVRSVDLDRLPDLP